MSRECKKVILDPRKWRQDRFSTEADVITTLTNKDSGR